MIFEGIINVHNDIFLILFSLLALLLKKQNKIGLAVLSITLGALIKYIPIILLPYIVNNEKVKKQLIYYLEFILVFLSVTFVLTGNISSILTVVDQTGKYANSLYLLLYLKGVKFSMLSKICFAGKVLFCILYFIQIYKHAIFSL